MKVDDEAVTRQHDLLLRGIAGRLEDDFGSQFTRDTLDHYVHDSYDALASRAKVVTHIPTFVDRFARQRMKALAKVRGVPDDHPPHVLFVCRRNDGTSQMAAALLHAEVGDGAVAHSAGSAPADDLLDEAVHVLAEIGVEMLAGFPKPVTTEIEEAADVIVTLDDHDDIPVVDGKHYQAWRLADPAPDGLDGYRAVRDDLRARVAELAASLVSKTPAPTHTAFDDDLDSLQRRVETTAGLVVGLARRVTSALANPDDVVLDAIIAEDDAIDQADHDTAISAVELIARRQPVAVDLRQILVLAQTSRHLERIADGAVEVAEILRSGRIDRHAPLTRELADMSRAVVTMTETTIDALIRRDVDRARKVAELDGKLDGEQESVFDDLVTARVNGLDRRTLLGLDDIARLLERAGDHAVDIAEETIFLVTGERTELGRPTAAESGYS